MYERTPARDQANKLNRRLGSNDSWSLFSVHGLPLSVLSSLSLYTPCYTLLFIIPRIPCMDFASIGSFLLSSPQVPSILVVLPVVVAVPKWEETCSQDAVVHSIQSDIFLSALQERS